MIVALVLVVVALSAVVRLVNLDVFPTLVFDEYFYVHDAGSIIHGRIGPRQPSPWKPGDGRSLAHPPLGTLSIAAGILALGDGPWGWRVPSAVAGTLLIALVYPLARRLGLAPPWALAALLLAASDTMLIVESRIGVLDPFVALWSAVCIYCALRYLQSGRPPLWLVLTGISGGLALASKWSGALALAAAVAIVALDWWWRRRAQAAGQRPVRPEGGPVRPEGRGGQAAGFAGRLAAGAACLVALPLAVYVASYADYFASGHTLRQWLHLQGYMASYNWNYQGVKDMASPPLSWIFDITPLWYRWAETPHGAVGLIAIGNPLLWWGAIAAFVGLLWLAWKRRDVRLAAAPLLVAILYLPWLATSRQSYIYYLTPVVPFLAIMVATAPRPPRRPRSAARPLGGVCLCRGRRAHGGGRRRHARLAPGGAGGPRRRAGGGGVRAAPPARACDEARNDRGRRRTTAASPGGGSRRLALHRRRGRPGRRLAALPGLVRGRAKLLRAPGVVGDLALSYPTGPASSGVGLVRNMSVPLSRRLPDPDGQTALPYGRQVVDVSA